MSEASPPRAQEGAPLTRRLLARAALAGPVLAALAWGLTGVTLVPMDARAVYERFGTPTAVLHPGPHATLPWPFGTTRVVEFGTVHEIGLEPRPATARRLWETPDSGEITLVTASDTVDRQSFQCISADLRVFYRTGLNDADALRGAYAAVEPEALVRALAGRVVAQYFAARTSDALLSADRAAMAATLRTRLQAALDQHAIGMEAIDIVIEAIHPPSNAADPDQNLRATEIAARTGAAVEHGAAASMAAQSRQMAYDMTDAAHAAAAENVSRARASLIRFNADHQAAQAVGQSFLLERYFTALSTALARTPKIIIDHRLNYPEAPVLDLRPYSAAAGAGAGKDE